MMDKFHEKSHSQSVNDIRKDIFKNTVMSYLSTAYISTIITLVRH